MSTLISSRQWSLSLPKIGFPDKNKLKGFSLTALSILIFTTLWHFSSQALYNIEASRKIEAVRKEQGDAEATKIAQCIARKELSCAPNTLPSPVQVVQAFNTLWTDYLTISNDKKAFYQKNEALNNQRESQGLESLKYTGRPSFVSQIFTSIKTVLIGVLLAALIAIPFGILLGLSAKLRTAINWFIQIFKPVSPVVWLLLVFMIVKTLLNTASTDKSFIISFISVALCGMWATLVNTSVGVSSVDKDYLNVAAVLQLSTFQKITKVILPASIPMIFTGLRITVSVAWMVLIAIELLAQSPGLGKFVWDEFQNGASDSNAKIIAAMFVIGIIGFLLDKIMQLIQSRLSYK